MTDPVAPDPGPSPPPSEFGGDAVIWAMWLYYSEGRTQNDVAQILGVSRATVANYLAEARRRGLVTISIAADALGRVEVARRLAERFGLSGAHVLPDAMARESAVALRRRVGAAGARMLTAYLADGLTLGVAWGRTMLEVARALPKRAVRGGAVVQVSGASQGDKVSSPEACTALIAGRLSASCRNLYAPAVVGSPDLRRALMEEPAIARHFELARRADVAVFAVGGLTREGSWADTDYQTEEIIADYIARGAVGVLIGRFVDAAGQEVPGALSGRQIGLELEDFRRTPIRICAAGGAEKLPAIRAMLHGGYATHLATDAGTAAALLDEA